MPTIVKISGDPNCHESDKGASRSLFNGLAQVIVQAGKMRGEIYVEAKKNGGEGPELAPAKIVIMTKQVELRPFVPTVRS